MRKFLFRFATVLRARKAREEECLRALGQAQQQFQLELERKRALQGALADSLLRREQLGSDAPASPLEFRMEHDFITGTKQRLIQQEQAIVRATRAVEKALRAYLMARRQTKMIETLRDREYAEHRKREQKREQREMDELTVMRSAREEAAQMRGESA
jgi:flagellar export protein FliJ